MPEGGPPGSTRADQIAAIAQYIKSRIGGNSGDAYAADWTSYANKHPNISVKKAFVGWYLSRAQIGKALGQSLGQAVGEAGKAINQIVKGTGAGLAPLGGIAGIGDFFGRLTEASTWIRVAEVLAGGLILYLGLKAVVTPAGKNVGPRTAKQTGQSIAKTAKKVGAFVK